MISFDQSIHSSPVNIFIYPLAYHGSWEMLKKLGGEEKFVMDIVLNQQNEVITNPTYFSVNFILVLKFLQKNKIKFLQKIYPFNYL